MLAMADRHGEVSASVPGLARFAGVTIEATEKAIALFLSPDTHSRTKDDQGRRIEAIEGGWVLLNHSKYRAMASKEDQKSKSAIRQGRHRKRAASQVTDSNASVTLSNASVTLSNGVVTPSNASVTLDRDIAEAEAEAEAEANNKKTNTHRQSGEDIAAEEIYQAYPRKLAKDNAIKAIKKAMKDSPVANLLEITKLYAASQTPGNPYTPYPASWFKGKRYEDDPAAWIASSNAPPAIPAWKRIKDLEEDERKLSSRLKECWDREKDPAGVAELTALRKEIAAMKGQQP